MDENVEAAEAGEDPGHQAAGCAVVGQIGAERRRPGVESFEISDCSLRFCFVVPITDRDGVTGPREGAGELAAEPPGPSRDEHDLGAHLPVPPPRLRHRLRAYLVGHQTVPACL